MGEDGVVTLRGEVSTALDRLAKDTGGVKRAA